MPDTWSDPLDPVTEIEKAHALLATWLGSEAPRQIFDEFARTLHAAFTMVTIDGTTVDRADLLEGLRAARNSRPGVVIEISRARILVGTAELVVVRFLERHLLADTHTDRLVTAVLSVDEVRGFRWRALQETAVAD
ncbi:hypothetical protein [Nocardia aurea]|uniref:DUF4440 domain-containing protein n=1 Tax=Nocardia aurea TaxID=2144174 RepID=A0ABV3G013_9NOCA